MHGFQREEEAFALSKLKVETWRHEASGFRVVIVHAPGPLIHGHLVCATEAFDDDGCPHVLEHLTFLGSRKYPYKGVLDQLANRSFAQGTNAWTAVDHTCYTMDTAGEDGFLQLLPVYLDHLLYPTLTSSGFHTEVHHIKGDGDDAGVVYCEMKARENTVGDISDYELRRALFSVTSSYRSETGGRLSNLRDLTVETVRAYHAQSYCAGNFCAVVVGTVDTSNLLQCIDNFLSETASSSVPDSTESMQQQQQGPEHGKEVERAKHRPFGVKPAPLRDSVQKEVQFPSDDEECGTVTLGWRTVNVTNVFEAECLSVLWDYLTDSPVALLQQLLVETADPCCADISVDFSYFEEVVVMLSFEGCPLSKMASIPAQITSILQGLCAGERQLDMHRMASVIEKARLSWLEGLERNPTEAVIESVIAHHVHAVQTTGLKAFLPDEAALFDRMAALPEAFWLELLGQWMVQACRADIVARPSVALQTALTEEETQRVAAQKASIGSDGLRALEEALETAAAANNAPIPEGLLAQFPIPPLDKFAFFQSQSHFRAALHCHYDQLLGGGDSRFMEIRLCLNTATLTGLQRRLLPLWCEAIFKMPMDSVGDHLAVATGLERDFVYYGASIGLDGGAFSAGSCPSHAVLHLQFEKSRYPTAIAWCLHFAGDVHFALERLEICKTTLLNNIPDEKRDGSSMARACLTDLIFDTERSNRPNLTAVRQQQWLNQAEGSTLASELQSMHASLFQWSQLLIQVVGSESDLAAVFDPWEVFMPVPGRRKGVKKSRAAESEAAPWILSQHCRKEEVQASGEPVCHVVAVGGTDSCFLRSSIVGEVAWGSRQQAVSKAAAEYLTALEGPLWKGIRGNGHAYGFNLMAEAEAGLVTFSLYRCLDVGASWSIAADCIRKAGTAEQIDALEFEGAISSLVYAILSKEESFSTMARSSFIDRLLHWEQESLTSSRQLLAHLSTVTRSEVAAYISGTLQRLFDVNGGGIMVIAAPPGKAEAVNEVMNPAGDVWTLAAFFEAEEVDDEDEDESDASTSSSGSPPA